MKVSLALAVLVAVLVAAFVAGCASPAATASPLPSVAPRPASPATVAIIEPASGATVVGDSVHIVLKLTGAKIVTETTTAIRPDEGHVHLYVDNVLVSMNYGLEQDVPVTPGSHVLKAEFVAADHAPYNPRVWSAETLFTVR